MKTTSWILAGLLILWGASQALAASDGNYIPARQHCSGKADWSNAPDYDEDGCHNWTLTISDDGGHEYFGWGIQQTTTTEEGPVPPVIPFGTGSSTHEMEVWYDLGDGCTRYKIDVNEPGSPAPSPCPWMDSSAPNYYPQFDAAPNPASGLRLYMGADDNLAGGEHDSSPSQSAGPSDGGAIEANIDLTEASLLAWMAGVMAEGGPSFLARHPLPVADGGVGFCADGICISAQSTRRDSAYPGGTPNGGSVANYEGHEWDPEECSGASAEPDNGGLANEYAECDGKYVKDWNDQNGAPGIDPGIQIYEDPDAQGSPIGPYPLPALYVGTCGVIIGGGPMAQMPPSDFTNDAGQIVIETACNTSQDQ